MLPTTRSVLKALLLSILLAPAPKVSATNFQWNSPASPTWEDSANWLPNTSFPQTSNDTANFLTGTFANPAISSSFSLNTINFSGGAYTLTLNPSAVLQLFGSINSNTSTLQNVLLEGALLGFNGITSSANEGVGTGGMAYTLEASEIDFLSSSTASNAQFNLSNLVSEPSALTFSNTSSAGSAQITGSLIPGALHEILFQNSSSADLATIMGSGVELIFQDMAYAGDSNISLFDSVIQFNSGNNASNAAVQGIGTSVSIGGINTTLAALNLIFDVAGSMASSLTVSADATIGFLSTDSLTPIILDGATLTFGNISSTTLAGPISGTGALQKVGGGTTLLTGFNTYSGGTIVTQGTLQGNTNSLQGNILDNATITFDQPVNGTYSGQLSGDGVVNILGGGILTFTGNSSGFTGTTNVSGSGLKIGITGQISGSMNLTNEGTLNLNHSLILNSLNSDASSSVNLNNLSLTLLTTGIDEINGPITGTGGILVLDGPGTLFLDGFNTYSGITKVLQGTLVGNTNSVQGNILNNGTVTFAQAFPGIYSGMMTGGGIVNFEGGGPFTFTGNSSSFTGTTFVSASTLESGPTGEWGGELVLIESDFILNSDQVLSSISADANSTINLNENTLVDQTSGTDVIAGTITGGTGSNLVMDGSGTLILEGNNSLSGLITILSGVLQGTTQSLTTNIDDESLLDINQNFMGSFDFTISGGGGVLINGAGGTGTIALTAQNSYEGGTDIAGGELQIGSDANLGALYDPNTTPDAVLIFSADSKLTATADFSSNRPIFIGTPTSDVTARIDTNCFCVKLTGDITDFASCKEGIGSLVKEGCGRLILTGDNTYSGCTRVKKGTLQGTTRSLHGCILDDATLNFRQDFDGIFLGSIGGTGQVVFDGEGTVTLTEPNCYSGGTLICSGAVQGDTTNLQGDIVDNSLLIFDQQFDGIFFGHLIGNGEVEVTGPGTVNIVFENHQFRGTTLIERGQLALEVFLGGDVLVGMDGIFSGRGTVGRNVVLGSGATLALKKDTLHVLGDFVQSADSTYVAEIDRFERSSLIDVRGTALIEKGATLQIVSEDGIFNPHVTYQLLFARDGLTGKYTTVLVDSPLILPELTYTANNVFLRTTPIFSAVTTTSNQQAVADQFEAAAENLTNSQKNLLIELLNLPPAAVVRAFDHMTAAQYSLLPLAAETENSVHQFIRRLYDPLRMLISTRPPLDPCDCCSCLDPTNVEVWGAISFNKSKFGGNCHSRGASLTNYELSAGFHKRFNPRWTAGAALAYDWNLLNFNLGGNGDHSTLLGALYTLYRPYGHYFIGDLVLGFTSGRVKRPIDLRTRVSRANGHVGMFEGAAYGELGRDWIYSSFLIQPFVGMELGFYNLGHLHENGAGLLNLDVHGDLFYTALSSLGVHISTIEEMTETLLGLDLAWLYRMTSTETVMSSKFRSFGDTFIIHGPAFKRNSFEITANVTRPINPIWDIYGEFTSRLWRKSNTYSFIAGFKAKW
jgi:autotransporter-associated beta strand protein